MSYLNDCSAQAIRHLNECTEPPLFGTDIAHRGPNITISLIDLSLPIMTINFMRENTVIVTNL